jgi:hypothetical protein
MITKQRQHPVGHGRRRLHPKVLTSLFNYLNVVTLDIGNTTVDILGDAFAYPIKKFANANKGGKVAGQFYIPGKGNRGLTPVSNVSNRDRPRRAVVGQERPLGAHDPFDMRQPSRK